MFLSDKVPQHVSFLFVSFCPPVITVVYMSHCESSWMSETYLGHLFISIHHSVLCTKHSMCVWRIKCIWFSLSTRCANMFWTSCYLSCIRTCTGLSCKKLMVRTWNWTKFWRVRCFSIDIYHEVSGIISTGIISNIRIVDCARLFS